MKRRLFPTTVHYSSAHLPFQLPCISSAFSITPYINPTLLRTSETCPLNIQLVLHMLVIPPTAHSQLLQNPLQLLHHLLPHLDLL